MARLLLIFALLLLLASAGCDNRRDITEGQPAAYWIDQSYSPDPLRQNRAIRALQHFPDEEAADARLAEIRDFVIDQREQNWREVCGWLRDAGQAREHAAEIVHHLENCPDQPGPDSPYSPIGFPAVGRNSGSF